MAQSSTDDIAAVLARYIDKASDSGTVARRIAAYLVESRSVKQATSIFRSIESARRKKGLVEAVVRSARPVTSGQRSQIERIIRRHVPDANKILVVEHVDPTLIGGVAVRVAGKEFDLTVRNKLERLKHSE